MSVPNRAVQFGVFAFDFRAQELRKNGVKIKLPASQIRLLTLFLERPGELVTRDQIESRLWTSTATIDAGRNINTIVMRLRVCLRDDPADPAYIETVIGLGYRFIAPVVSIPDSVEQQTAVEQQDTVEDPDASEDLVSPGEATETHAKTAKRRIAWVAGCAAAVALGVALLMVHRPLHPMPTPSKPTDAPMTALRPVTFDQENKVTAEAISPDGHTLAYADESGISLNWFDAKPERLMDSLPSFSVDRIAWFPDSLTMAVSGTDLHTHHHQVWGVTEGRSYPRLILDDADLAAISPDGSRLAYVREQGKELWTAGKDGQDQRRLAAADNQERFSFFLWSLDGKYLIVAGRRQGDSQAGEQWFHESIDETSGRVLDRAENVEIDSAYLQAGGRLEFLTKGDRMSGRSDREVWMGVQTDPATGRFLEPPQQQRELHAVEGHSLSSSLDGKKVAVVLQREAPNVFVGTLREGGAALGQVEQLTHSMDDAYPHSWTRDGAVLFETKKQGRYAVFAQAPGTAEARMVAQPAHDAANEQLSPDGKWVLYQGFEGTPLQPTSLFRAPIAGGAETIIPATGQVEDFHCPTSPARSCVASESVGREELVYYALDPVAGMGKELAHIPWRPHRLGDWSLSPDGTTVATVDHSTTHPQITLIRLNAAPGSPSAVETIPFPGHGVILGSNWTADGRALLVECSAESGFQLFYRDFAGHERELLRSPLLVWGVPSPDGRKLAFPGATSTSNVWMLR